MIKSKSDHGGICTQNIKGCNKMPQNILFNTNDSITLPLIDAI